MCGRLEKWCSCMGAAAIASVGPVLVGGSWARTLAVFVRGSTIEANTVSFPKSPCVSVGVRKHTLGGPRAQTLSQYAVQAPVLMYSVSCPAEYVSDQNTMSFVWLLTAICCCSVPSMLRFICSKRIKRLAL